MPDTNRAVLQGTVDLLVLKTLSWGPRHGYAIARWIEETTDDVLRIEEGSVPRPLPHAEAGMDQVRLG
jgi:DNA-binding PadR family transcriptional regulator